TTRPERSASATETAVSANRVGSSGTGGGPGIDAGAELEKTVELPTWIWVICGWGAGVVGPGARTTLITYCPAGTPRNVNSPAAPVIVTAVSRSFWKSPDAWTRRKATFATGPSGPTTVPLTLDARIGWSEKSTFSRSCPDAIVMRAARAALGAAG